MIAPGPITFIMFRKLNEGGAGRFCNIPGRKKAVPARKLIHRARVPFELSLNLRCAHCGEGPAPSLV